MKTGNLGEFIENEGIEIGNIICRRDDVEAWGIVKSFSDDGTCVYYSPKGASLLYQCAVLKDVRKWTSYTQDRIDGYR